MPGDEGLRVGSWVPDSTGTHSQPSETGTGGEPREREWWEDMPDPWDRPLPRDGADQATTGEPDSGADGAIHPRATRDAGLRRLALVTLLMGVVLIGSGALATMLRPEPSVPLPGPPTPEGMLDNPPDVVSRLDTAPTTSPTGGAAGGPVTSGPVLTAEPGPGPGVTPAPGDEPDPVSPPTPEPVLVASFEAEDAQLRGLARTYPDDEASGGQAVGGLGMWGISHVRFPEITVPDAGEYELTFHYLGERDRTGQFSVNDGSMQTVEFAGLTDGTVGSVTVTVTLAAGDNEIWFGGTGLTAPDLDRITVTG